MCTACEKNNARGKCINVQCGECCNNTACRVHRKRKRAKSVDCSLRDRNSKLHNIAASLQQNTNCKLETKSMCFRIVVGNQPPGAEYQPQLKPNSNKKGEQKILFGSQNNVQFILDSPFCNETVVRELWAQKERLSAVFDSGKESQYYEVRDWAFPNDHKGSRR